jgi:hypothetical protein
VSYDYQAYREARAANAAVERLERQLREARQENKQLLEQQGEILEAFNTVAARMDEMQQSLDAILHPKLDKKPAAGL